MADDDDQEEFLDVEEEPDSDVRDSAVASEMIQVINGSKTGSKSLTSGSVEISEKSVSDGPAPDRSKSGSIKSGSVKTNGSGSVPGSQHSKKSHDTLEETSKSHEVIRKSQELSLSGKQSSLDRLSEKKETGQRTKCNKWQRQCNRQFRAMIGKREMKNEELERQQGDLRERLNILECSMPAVMVWNIWRMTQGANAPCLQQVLEKQFQGPASGEVYCPTSPSRHFDCRVREAEAERKQAQMRVEEARTLWAEKMANLEDREKRLQEARQLQEEQQKRIEQLTSEVQKLREARTNDDDGACEAGECGVIECKRKWLEKVPSSASIRSTDIECLEKLQELAEAELCMKRQIADLERREDAYMKTLQQADELWKCIEGDGAGTIQEQLEVKTNRIAELEDELKLLRAKMATCRAELEKYMSIGKIEALIGRDDDFADVTDREAEAGVDTKDGMTPVGEGMDDERSGVESGKDLSGKGLSGKDLSGKDLSGKDLSGKDLSGKDLSGKDLSGKDLSGKGPGVRPEHVDIEETTVTDAKYYLAQLASLSELDADPGTICGPDFDCNDLGLSESGLPEDEKIALEENRVTARELLEKYGLLEIAEKMWTGDGTQYRTAVKSVTQRMEDGLRKEGELLTEEVVEREIVYDEKDGGDDGLKEDEMGEVKEEVGEDEEEVGEDEVEVGEDQVEMGEDQVEVGEDKVEVGEDDVGEKISFPSRMAEDVLVPMEQLCSWQDRVHAVCSRIVNCERCYVVYREAGIVADELEAYTGRTMELEEKEPIPKEKEPSEIAEEVEEAELVDADVKEEVFEVESEEKEGEVKDEREEVDEKVTEEYSREEAPVSAAEVKTETLADEEEAIAVTKEIAAEEEEAITVKKEIVAEKEEAETAKREKLAEEEAITVTKEKVTEEEEAIAVKKEKAAKEAEAIAAKKEQVAEEVEAIAVKKEQVAEEVEAIAVKKEKAAEEAEAITAKKEQVAEEEAATRIKKEKAAEEAEAVTAKKEQVAEEEAAIRMKKEKAAEEGEEITVTKEKLAEEEAAILAKKEQVAEEEEAVAVKKEKVAEDEEAITVTKEKVAQEEGAITAKEEKIAEEAEAVTADKERIKKAETEEEEAKKVPEDEILPEKEEAEEVEPEIAKVMEEVEDRGPEEKEPEPTVKEEVEEVPPEEETKMKVEKAEIELEELVPEEDEVEEIPLEELKEFEEAIEVDIIPVEEEPEPEEKEEVSEEIVPPEEVPEKFEIIPEEVEDISMEGMAELKPEEIVPEEKEIEVDVIPKEEPLKPEEEEIVEIPLEEAEEEITAEVPEMDKIELEVEMLEDAKVAEVDVEIELAPVEVLKEKEEDVAPEEPEEIEVSIDEECICNGIYGAEYPAVEYLFPPVEEVAEEESVCQCTAEEYPPVEEEDTGECQCSTDAPPVQEEESADCQCTDGAAEVTSVQKEDSDVCKCTSKAPSEGKTPSVKTEASSVCKCTSKAPSEEKSPSVKTELSGTCKCTSKTRSVKKGDSSSEKKDSGVCQCALQPPTVVSQKMEVTQTSITQFSCQKTTIQAVTQTVVDVGMQAHPPPKQQRHPQKIPTRVIDADPEILERLARWKRSQEPSGATTTFATSQTEKSSFLKILQTLKTTGAYGKLEPEKELRSIHYVKKSDDVEGRCNCCLCGFPGQDTVQRPPVDAVQTQRPPSDPVQPQRPPSDPVQAQRPPLDPVQTQRPPLDTYEVPGTPADTLRTTQASSVLRLLQALPLLNKPPPGVDQGVQHESCSHTCKTKRRQKSPRSPAPTTLIETKQVQTTKDQEVSVSTPSSSPSSMGSTCCKSNQSDETSMATVKVQKLGKRTQSVNDKNSQQESEPVVDKAEDPDLVKCICNSTETASGPKKVRCACGDPD